MTLVCFLAGAVPARAQLPGVGGAADTPAISIGAAKTTAEKVADVLLSLEAREKNLLAEQSEVLRWRDDLAAVEARIEEVRALRAKLAGQQAPAAGAAGDQVAPGAAAEQKAPGAAADQKAPGAPTDRGGAGASAATDTDPALLPHVDLRLEMLGNTRDMIAALQETYRQEQRDVAQALKLARKLAARFKESAAATAEKGEMAEVGEREAKAVVLEEILRYMEEVSRGRIAVSLLKARRAGLNEELEQKLKEKRPPFALPPLPEAANTKQRKLTMELRDELTEASSRFSRYRKLYNRHVAGAIEAQLEGIRLEIYEKEEDLIRLEEGRERVFLALSVPDADVESSKERLDAAQKKIEADSRDVQKQLKDLRTAGAPEKTPGTFTPWQEYQIRITALQHRLYLLDIERQVETFRAATVAALHPLVRLRPAPGEFWAEYEWYLDESRQEKAREEIDTRREAWRQEYSRLSLDEPEPQEADIAASILLGYREVLSLYDTIDARKWEIAWCAELVRFYNDRYEESLRDGFWYGWRIAVSVLMLAVAIFLSILLNRASLRPFRKNPNMAEWKRYTLFLSYLAVLVLLWGALVVLTLTNVWGEVFQFERVSEIATLSLFMIGEKEISLLTVGTFIGVLALTVVVNRLIGRFLKQHIFTYFTWDEGVRHAVLAVVKYLILFSGIALGLELIGVGLSALALFAGVIGIGIGFGLQNVASNFIAGLIILFERPIKKGDFVDAAGLEGQVEEIKARSTTLVTRDRVSVIVPNSEFIGKSVVNLSHGSPEVRLHVPVGVAYGTDVQNVVAVLKGVAAAHPDVLPEPEPDVLLNSFGDSALNFELLAWTESVGKKGKIISDLNFAISAAFKQHGIEIPFPQQEVHVRDLPPR